MGSRAALLAGENAGVELAHVVGDVGWREPHGLGIGASGYFRTLTNAS